MRKPPPLTQQHVRKRYFHRCQYETFQLAQLLFRKFVRIMRFVPRYALANVGVFCDFMQGVLAEANLMTEATYFRALRLGFGQVNISAWQ